MNKTDLITKYEHRLTLKNYSENTLRAYLSGLNIFLDYVKVNQISNITPKVLDTYFHYCKKELEYSYLMMKQLLASVKFLYEEVLQEEIDFDFYIKMKKPSRIPVVLSVEEVQRLLNSFTNTKQQTVINGQPTAYICKNYSCDLPVHSAEEFRERLSNK